MSISGWFSNLFGTSINPASGLPMNDDSGIDVGGNSFGTDSMSSDTSFFESSDPFSDSLDFRG
ncbi:hypothetical protein ACTVJH_15750 [Desulfoplanes sp. PS50]